MTQTELIHSSYAAATTSVPTASPVTITAGTPEIVLPAGVMSVTGKRSTSLRLKMGGYMTATAVVPTFAFGLAYQVGPAVVGFSAATPLCGISNAITPTAGSGSWQVEWDIGLRTLGQLNTSTIWCSGMGESNLSTSNWVMNPSGSGGTTVTVWQSDQAYYIWPYLTLSAATAGNTVTTQFVKLYGEN